MSVLNTTLQTMVVQLRDLSGNITQSKLHNRVFDAYEAKHLVFECITPEQQAVMQEHKGTIPAQHTVGLPYLIESWQELVTVHNDRNVYQLLPRHAKHNVGYGTLQGICMSIGSPFQMDHRLNVNDYKMVFRAQDIDMRNNFNAANVDKVTSNIWFDGLLANEKDTAFINCYPSLTAAHISNLAGSVLFLNEWLTTSTDERHRDSRKLYEKLLKSRTHMFLGTLGNPGRELINLARSKGIHIYSRRGFRYHYCP